MAFLALDNSHQQSPAPARQASSAGLSELEWSVVAVARRDGLGTLHPPDRLARLIRLVFGKALPNPRLASPRLEALRRTSVLAWRKGYSILPSELSAFLAAGFSLDQYEALQSGIGRARAAANQGHRR